MNYSQSPPPPPPHPHPPTHPSPPPHLGLLTLSQRTRQWPPFAFSSLPKKAYVDLVYFLECPLLDGDNSHEICRHSLKHWINQFEPGSSFEKSPFPHWQSIGHLINQRLHLYSARLPEMHGQTQIITREGLTWARKRFHYFLQSHTITLNWKYITFIPVSVQSLHMTHLFLWDVSSVWLDRKISPSLWPIIKGIKQSQFSKLPPQPR
jgi:hypothetical protein